MTTAPPTVALVRRLAVSLEHAMSRSIGDKRHMGVCEAGLWVRSLRPAPCSQPCQLARQALADAERWLAEQEASQPVQIRMEVA